MTQKQLSKLDRADLLRVMTAQSREIEALRSTLGAGQDMAGRAAESGQEADPAGGKPHKGEGLPGDAAGGLLQGTAGEAGRLPGGEAIRLPDGDAVQLPDSEELLAEVKRETAATMHFRGLTRLIYAIIALVAVLFVISMFWMPVVQMHGNSMAPTLKSGDIVLAKPEAAYERGDVIAFHFNSGMLVKRVIGVGGDVIDMDEQGRVTVNGQLLDEPYIEAPAYGQIDLVFPYGVPEDRYFVMGDDRAVSVDSRSTALGTIPHEQIGGKVFLRLWPLGGLGGIK